MPTAYVRCYVLAASLLFALPVFAQGAAPSTQSAPVRGGETTSASQPPAHPATEDQVREYLTLTGISTAVHSALSSNVDSMQTGADPYYPVDFWADMKAAMLKIDLVAVYAPVMQRHLSQEDMVTILAFYRSPAGKNFLSVQPDIARDAQLALQRVGGETGQAVFARHKDEIETAKKKYEAEHPGAAK